MEAERRARAPVQQPQAEPLAAAEAAVAAAQQAAGGAVPVSEAGTSPVPASVTKDSEVAPTPQPAVWNVPTGESSCPNLDVLRYRSSIHIHAPGISAYCTEWVSYTMLARPFHALLQWDRQCGHFAYKKGDHSTFWLQSSTIPRAHQLD